MSKLVTTAALATTLIAYSLFRYNLPFDNLDFKINKTPVTAPIPILEDEPASFVNVGNFETVIVKQNRKCTVGTFRLPSYFYGLDESLDKKEFYKKVSQLEKEINIETLLDLNLIEKLVSGHGRYITYEDLENELSLMSKSFETSKYKDILSLPEGFEFNHDYTNDDTENLKELFEYSLIYDDYPKGSTIRFETKGKIRNRVGNVETMIKIENLDHLESLRKFILYRSLEKNVLPVKTDKDKNKITDGSYINAWYDFYKNPPDIVVVSED